MDAAHCEVHRVSNKAEYALLWLRLNVSMQNAAIKLPALTVESCTKRARKVAQQLLGADPTTLARTDKVHG